MHAMSSVDAAGPNASSPPDWATLQAELHCPRCGYNLRMLTGSRCPECGLDLDWDRIIASAQCRIDSPLFEYRWRKEPWKSFVRTIWLAMQPWHLWKRIPLADEPDVGGLVLFTALASLFYAIASSIIVYLGSLAISAALPPTFIKLPPSAWWLPVIQILFEGVVATFVQLIFAASLVAFLGIFHRTISRYQIRPRQILRLIVLAWTPLLIVKTIDNAAYGTALAYSYFHRSYLNPPLWNEIYLWCAPFEIVALSMVVLSLGYGLSAYLRISQGWVTAAMAFGLAILFWTTLSFTTVWLNRGSAARAVQTFQDNWPGLVSLVGWLLRL